MLPKENDDGNIEYKRSLVNVHKIRLNELASQMKYRLNEDDSKLAIYYLGVDDDGTVIQLNDYEKEETLKTFNILLEMNNAEILKFEILNENNINYFKITIKVKTIIYPETKIILLGNSESGKTTFLSNILLNKIKARIYLMNHKHEIQTGKTSSINIHYKIHNNKKYSFIDTPGDETYSKTKYKILLGIKPDIVLLFSDNTFDKFICDNLNIPYILINTFDSDSIYNCNKLINKEHLFNEIDNKIIPTNNHIPKGERTITKGVYVHRTIFNIMNIYPQIENITEGVVMSGYLKQGKLEIDKNIYWFKNNRYLKCKVKSIYINGESVKEISNPQLITICLYHRKPLDFKNGILTSKKIKPIKDINFNYISYDNNELPNSINGYCENKIIKLNNINNSNCIINNYYLHDNNYIIIDNKNNKGIIKLKTV